MKTTTTTRTTTRTTTTPSPASLRGGKTPTRRSSSSSSSSSRTFAIVLAVLVGLGCLKMCCVGLFARGFLFIRVELAQKSWSHRVSSSDSDVSPSSSPSRIDKLIVLIIDAARYDWVATSSSGKFEESESDHHHRVGLKTLQDYYNTAQKKRKKKKKDYVDNVDVGSESPNSLLFKFIADAPTTTSQRLKGLLTGSLPTFVDISNSFSSKTLEEDNLIHQLQQNGKKRILFSGDDTWAELFPSADNGNNLSSRYSSYFADFEAFPSMNVKDTETVDTGVRNSWKKAHALAMRNRNGSNTSVDNKNTSDNSTRDDDDDADWDVWIGHMLGADHVGHTYGAKTKEMKKKLEQNDRDIRNIMNDLKTEKEVYAKALFLVFGDHGMTDEGDHGGSSEVEVNSFLFAHRPHGNIAAAFEDDEDEDDDISTIRSKNEMMQIDLVPTLSVLMGVPIPFSSLGLVNEKLWDLCHNDEEDDANTNSDTNINNNKRISASFERALDQNVRQVWRYINAYHRIKRFETSAFTRIEEMHVRYQNLSRLENTGSSENKKDLGVAFLKETQRMTRNSWVTFGLVSMVFGIVCFSVVLLLYVYYIAYFTFVDATAAECEIGRRKKVAMNSNSLTSFPYLFLVSFAVYFLSLAARCSNSFIESERETYQYLLATLLAATCIDRLRSRKRKYPRDSYECSKTFTRDGVIYNAIQALLCNAILARIGETWMKTNSTEEISSSRESFLIFTTFCFAISHDLQNFEMTVSWLFWAFSAMHGNNLWYPRIVFACSWIWFPITRLFGSLSPRRRMNSRDFLWTLLPVFAVLTNSTHIGGIFVLLSARMMDFSALSISNMLASFPSTPRPDARRLEQLGSIFAASVASLFFSQVIFYGGGHWVKFNGLRFTAGMTGMDSFNWYLCGFLLGLDTFCGEIISVLMFPIFLSYFSSAAASSSSSSSSVRNHWVNKEKEEKEAERVDLNVRCVGVLMLALLRGLGVLVSTSFVAYERRHLMTWAIFAPKFIFEICSLLVFECILVFSFVLASKTRAYESLSAQVRKRERKRSS